MTGCLQAGVQRIRSLMCRRHGVNHEQPERVNRELVGFLKGEWERQ